MADVKISELPAVSSVSADDLVPIVTDSSGTPTTARATLGALAVLAASAGTTRLVAPYDSWTPADGSVARAIATAEGRSLYVLPGNAPVGASVELLDDGGNGLLVAPGRDALLTMGSTPTYAAWAEKSLAVCVSAGVWRLFDCADATTIRLSDSLDGPDATNVNNRSLDNALGGDVSRTWSSGPNGGNQSGLLDNALHRPGGGTAGWRGTRHTAASMSAVVEWEVRALPDEDNFGAGPWLRSPGGTAASGYVARMFSDGTCQLVVAVDQSFTTLASAGGSLATGDRLALTAIELYDEAGAPTGDSYFAASANNTAVSVAVDATLTTQSIAGWLAINRSGDWSVDNYIYREIS